MSDDGANLVRRRVLTAVTSAVGAVGAVGAAVPFVGSWNPSERAKAAGAPVEANIGKIEPGQMVTFEWRGKPVYVVRRTKTALAGLQTMEPLLRDPSSEESIQPDYVDPKLRSQKDEYLVLLGLCTHLGCAPNYQPKVGSVELSGAEWQGGFFCKCHGSKYDLAGRVFQGVPAPTNLEVPPHKYLSDSVILIGVDQNEEA
ncbi:ubiquinol-cytochrome c reductase iron-sulfur subunit [Marinagarivorans cellulosilyticus]|uniref:Ubiquinol-cytochrome c reductase iron-sulfur subunit n=1 Tax=Marinagarivorans cellulosilyticus TaxID=2721545 RepID=A0AAN2BK39_9GAMM|nr:ubiquinol-cytochrome c reductase iron-sulfur subunit [Marinagarivorans cellulosilyticus]BCD97594.1 ubiquinol-cytochrome c reductase iron-sulfur subunit [Marinagarivorans cellulosilyticus]